MFKQKAQAITEYLIIFAVLACIVLLSVSAFYPKVQSVGEELFKKATEGILQ